MKLTEIKQLNESRSMTDPDEIKAWLDKIGVQNFVIKPDGTVDADGDVSLDSMGLISIPVQFGVVTEDFDCGRNQLTSLAGCPSSVGGDFYCYSNNLTSLAGCPSSVGGYFYCSANKLTSLEGIADQLTSMKGKFGCDDGKIKSHVLGLMLINGITQILCTDKWALILNRCIENRLGIYDAQTMLMEAELEEYTQL